MGQPHSTRPDSPQDRPEIATAAPQAATVALLPAARVSDAHLVAVLEAALASPGLPLDALRHKTHLAPDPFLDAVRALKARNLLRAPSRQGAGATRARVYPTDEARRYPGRATAAGSRTPFSAVDEGRGS